MVRSWAGELLALLALVHLLLGCQSAALVTERSPARIQPPKTDHTDFNHPPEVVHQPHDAPRKVAGSTMNSAYPDSLKQRLVYSHTPVGVADNVKYDDALARDRFLPLAAAAYSDRPEDCLRRRLGNITVS